MPSTTRAYTGLYRVLDYRGYLADIELALALAFGPDDYTSMYHAFVTDTGMIISKNYFSASALRFPTQASLCGHIGTWLRSLSTVDKVLLADKATDLDRILSHGRQLVPDGFRIVTFEPELRSRAFRVTPAWIV